MITYGIPQGSVLGLTLFNIHIDSISDVCDSCDIVLYADDTGIHTSSKDVKIAEQYVNEDLGRVTDRLSTDGLICNHKKSEAILIGSKHAVKNAPDLQIIMDGRLLKQCEDFKYLFTHSRLWLYRMGGLWKEQLTAFRKVTKSGHAYYPLYKS